MGDSGNAVKADSLKSARRERFAIFFDLYNAILALRIIERMLHVIPTAPDDSGEVFTRYGFRAIRPALHVNVRTIQESIRHGRQTTL
ncbi:hypothetical protein [Burkholderia sp. AU15512]|uniref:hypothetical protein n=1 Tax=Burkholderia sp. AU15512 TaxID=2015345 RepID=UPI0015C65EC9|nr:hypothetical protein [Burkholderia sp. AU15512]